MVKNTIGGKKGKMLSKKQHSATDSGFPVSTNENEIYVYVTKIFGGGVFEAVDSRNITYKAYLRGKMKGSNKRHNIVTIHSLLLVGIRADFTDKNSVDILFVYDHNHLISISLVPLSTIVAAYHRICRYWATFICVCIDCIHFTSIKEVYMIHMATIKLRIRQVNNRVHRIILCLEMGMIQSEIAYLVVTCPFWDRYFS